jgi:hypothetical protein
MNAVSVNAVTIRSAAAVANARATARGFLEDLRQPT